MLESMWQYMCFKQHRHTVVILWISACEPLWWQYFQDESCLQFKLIWDYAAQTRLKSYLGHLFWKDLTYYDTGGEHGTFKTACLGMHTQYTVNKSTAAVRWSWPAPFVVAVFLFFYLSLLLFNLRMAVAHTAQGAFQPKPSASIVPHSCLPLFPPDPHWPFTYHKPWDLSIGHFICKMMF